ARCHEVRGTAPDPPPRGAAPGPDRKEPEMAFVTVEHVYQLIEARYEAMPVIAIAEATIFVVPEPVAEHFGMTVLATYRDMITFMANHRSGRLAELFAATINESHGLGLIDETGDYTV